MDVKGINKSNINLKIKAFIPILTIALRGALGFLLARGIIFAEYAPYGLAWCAVGGGAGTIGAILGYISMLYKANSLKYMAICILIYTADYVFKDTEIAKKRIFMPAATLICTAAIGIVFVIDSTNSLKNFTFYICEITLSALCAYFYSLALRGKSEKQRKIGIAILAATLILPLSGIKIFALSLGQIIAILLILTVGYYGGAGAGSAAGVTLSFILGSGTLSAVYGMCGLVAPLFKTKGQVVYAVAFLSIGVLATLWITMDIGAVFIAETLCGATAFLLISRFYGEKIQKLFYVKEKADNRNRLQEQIRERVGRIGEAFYQLSRIFSGRKEKEAENYASVLDAPLHKVCRKCVLAKTCWEIELAKTKDNLTFVTEAIEKRGELKKEDFPIHFSSRCIKIDEFVSAANAELFKLLYRKKQKAEIDESRGILKKQYGEMAKIMSHLKNEINLTPDEQTEAKISDFFEKKEIIAYPTVYRDSKNRVNVEIEGERLTKLCCEEFASDLSDFLGVKLASPTFRSEGRVTMRQKENLRVMMGAAFNKKKGNDVSGDAGSYYRTENGCLALVLADGMGSGSDAAYVSANAIKMVERFHRAKIDMNISLSAINTALTVKSEESTAFTTIDFMEMDLYNGKTQIYKLGSAPTYVRHNGRVRKIGCTSLPAGVPVATKKRAEKTDLQVYPGDFLIFITDGVCDAAEDEWLVELISSYNGKSARELSGEIIAAASAKYGNSDDMTVFITYVDKNR